MSMWILCEDNKEIIQWHNVNDGLPPKKGKYLVVYHPCVWDSIAYNATEIGTDSFLGKTKWAKHKYQYVTHWAFLPGLPKECAV